MIVLFILIYAALAALVYLMFRVLRKTVRQIDKDSKKYYIDKLSEYDKLIDDKEKKLETLNKEIENKKVEAEAIKASANGNSKDFDISILDLMNKTKYQDSNFMAIEKLINDNFDYNYEKIVKEFLSKIDNEKDYKFCDKLRKKFTPQTIYELKILSDEKLEERLSEILTKRELEFFIVYKKTHLKFNFEEFITYLDQLVELNDPSMIIYVGERNISFNKLSKHIKTKYDPNIYKGIKILFRSRMYDFSLNGRDL